MAEDTRTQAPQVTDGDVGQAAREADLHVRWCDAPGDCRQCRHRMDMWRLGLEEVAPAQRARWVAEALEKVTLELQDRCDREDRKHPRERTEVWIDAAVITRDRAAEYRDGKR